MRSVFALSIAAFTGLVAAQDAPQMGYPYTIDPDTVDQSTRDYWCAQNTAQCPLICLQQPGVDSMTTEQNDCDSDALTYTCVCDNGVAPNITQYSQTLPYFICQQWGNTCVDNCNGNAECQRKCREDHPCGAQDPYRGSSTSSGSSMASTPAPSGSNGAATNTIPVTGFGGASQTGSSDSNNNNNNGGSSDQGGAGSIFMPNAGLGLAALFGSVFFGFAVLL